MCYLTLTRAAECRRGEKTTCRRRDAPLDTKSSRASPSHTSRPSWNNPMVRKLAFSLFFSGEKNESISMGGTLSLFLSFSLSSRRSCWAFYHGVGTPCDIEVLGGAFRGFGEGNQSGKKLNITPRRARSCILAREARALRSARSQNFGLPGLIKPGLSNSYPSSRNSSIEKRNDVVKWMFKSPFHFNLIFW